jgi:hypothetical protein
MNALILLSEWQKSQIEFWRRTNIEGYDVSSFGRVRSYWKRKGVKGFNGNHSYLSDTFRYVRGHRTRYGYIVLTVKGGGNPIVHRLVATAFLENPKREVNHKNCVKADNRLDNLEWATSAENSQHAEAAGMMYRAYGEDCTVSKLTESDVRAIRQRVAVGESQRSVAKDYPVHSGTINKVCTGRLWGHIQ